MSHRNMRSKYRHIRRKSITKIEPQGYQKDANAVYRGILRDRAKRYCYNHNILKNEKYVQIQIYINKDDTQNHI